MRIGFLFNHDQIHQVAHTLPIVISLAQARVDAELVAATTSERLTREVRRLGGELIGGPISLVELGMKTSTRLTASAFEAVLPAKKLLVYGDNLDFFRSLDVLVVAELTSLILKTRHQLKHLKIVYVPHGAGDRAIGFDPATAKCDRLLVAGPKIRDRLIRDAGVSPERIEIVGYPKFDMVEAPVVHPVIDEQRPVVLYNPHVSPHLSSWYAAGRKILDWFVEHEEYQLIFAPHVMLFERPFVFSIDKLRLAMRGRIEERYLRSANIHIDLGSRACTTMAYTQRADIYLGDASSQVYEFIRQPRPCIFLNPRSLDWAGDPNFEHWRAGRVIRSSGELGEALAAARSEHADRYAQIQRELFEYTFDLQDEPSCVRAARAVTDFTGVAFHEHASERQEPPVAFSR